MREGFVLAGLNVTPSGTPTTFDELPTGRITLFDGTDEGEFFNRSTASFEIPIGSPSDVFIPFADFDGPVSPTNVAAISMGFDIFSSTIPVELPPTPVSQLAATSFGLFDSGQLSLDAIATTGPMRFDIAHEQSIDVRSEVEFVSDVVVPGQLERYRITVTNDGPDFATDVAVTSNISGLAEIVFESAATDGVIGNTATGVGQLNDVVQLPAGGSVTYLVAGELPANHTDPVSAIVEALPETIGVDRDVTNNEAETTIVVTPHVDLAITKSDNVTSLFPGDTSTYQIVITNVGPSDARGVTVRDVVPDGLEDVSFSSEGSVGVSGNSSGSGEILDIVTIPAGGQLVYRVTGLVTRTDPDITEVINEASVEAALGVVERNLDDNVAIDTNIVLPFASISGTVWNDQFGDRITVDDVGLAGQTLLLRQVTADGQDAPDGGGTVDTVVNETVSDATGRFHFDGLRPGQYHVQIVPDDRFIVTEGGDASEPDRIVTQLDTGEVREGVDFGVFGLATFRGFAWVDRTGDGISSDDVPMPGVTIELYRDDGNGQFDSADRLESTQATTQEGESRFTDVEPGLYFIQQVAPSGHLPTVGGDQGNLHFSIRAISSTDVDNLDFANAPLATIAGQIVNDRNGNGVADPSEEEMAGVVVELRDANGVAIQRVTTPESGQYLFADLLPARYQIAIVPEIGKEVTIPSFRFGESIPVRTSGNVTGQVLAANVDHDQHAEIVAVNDLPSSLDLYRYESNGLADGSGDLVALDSVLLDDHSRPQSVAAGDFDHDGDIDMAVAAVGRPVTGSLECPAEPAGTLFLLANDGEGRFSIVSRIDTGNGPIDVTATDIDNDGNLDLAVASFRDATVTILQGDGQLAFTSTQILHVGEMPSALDTADLDADGAVDLVVTDYGAGDVIFYRNVDGQYEESNRWNNLGRPIDVVARDIDQDGRVDVVVTEQDSGMIYVGHHDDEIASIRVKSAAGARGLTIADLNDDQILDLMVAGGESGVVAIHFGLSDGSFAAPFTLSPTPPLSGHGVSVQSIEVVDFDGDGDNDVVTGLHVGGFALMPQREPIYDVEVAFGDALADQDFGVITLGTDGFSLAPGSAGALSTPPETTSAFGVAAQPSDSAVPPRESVPTHPSERFDTNGDGHVSGIDVLLVINALNRRVANHDEWATSDSPLDVNRDHFITGLDALLIINYLNAEQHPASASAADRAASTARLSSNSATEGTSSVDDRATLDRVDIILAAVFVDEEGD